MPDDPRVPGAVSRGGGSRRRAGSLPGGYADPIAPVMARALRHGVYVHACPELVALLMQVDLDASIPPRLYDVIAELLVWIEEMDVGAGRASTPKPR